MLNSDSFPNTLHININTNIPGFSHKNYDMLMSVPNETTKISEICFNPLIQLNKSIIKTIPENIRTKEFFDKDLFQSLIYSHGNQEKNKSLIDATNDGFVDNNIEITLNTLFPNMGHFYINEQVYTIADLQWTKGDWKIDVKPMKFIDLFDKNIHLSVKNKRIYNNIIKNKIKKGEKQLEKLPEDIIYGPNYDREDEDDLANLNNTKKGGNKINSVSSKKESLLSYYITIELFLQKGDTITKEQFKKIKCEQKWNAVRKSYAKFTRKKYVIKPVYDKEPFSKKKNNKTAKIIKKKNSIK